MQSQGGVDRLCINGPSVARHATSNHEETMYPSLPGVEGAQALAREARRADSRLPRRKCDAALDSIERLD